MLDSGSLDFIQENRIFLKSASIKELNIPQCCLCRMCERTRAEVDDDQNNISRLKGCPTTISHNDKDVDMKKSEMILGVAAIALLLLPIRLEAQQGGKINFGNLSIIPGVEVQGVYDDNIYKGNGLEYTSAKTTLEEKKEADWVTHAKPSFALNYMMPERGNIRLGYQGDFAFYDKNDRNNWKNNQGLLDVNYLAPGGLILGINDMYADGADPLGNADQYAIGRVTKKWTNDLKTKLGYHLTDNFRTILYYNMGKQKYSDIADYSQDYTENEYGVSVEARFLPKTWGFVRYHYGQRRYDTLGLTQTTDEFNSDYKWSRVSAGLGWDPGAKLSGEFNVGYQMLKYNNEYADAAKTLRREDKNTWTAATSINFQATESTDLSLNINRSVRNSGSDNNEQFTDTGIGFSIKQRLLTKVSLTAGLTYSRNEYNIPLDDPRMDDNYSANLGINYAVQDWLGFGVGYNYSRKKSNAELNDYTDNQFMATLKIVY